MANELPRALATGTLGEILVQLRLLQFDVQAAPPIKDTGNDLVAFRGRTVRTIQVKTSLRRVSRDKRLPKHFDVLALVWLDGQNPSLCLDTSRIFLIPRADLAGLRRSLDALRQFELRHDDPEAALGFIEWVFG